MSRVKDITVLQTHGTDEVLITTDLPCPFIKECPHQGPLVLRFDATWGNGEKYVKDTFGIDPNVIDVR